MVEISKTELQTLNIKIFEKCETKIIKNPRRRISFFLNTLSFRTAYLLEQSCQTHLRQEVRSNLLQTSSFTSVL